MPWYCSVQLTLVWCASCISWYSVYVVFPSCPLSIMSVYHHLHTDSPLSFHTSSVALSTCRNCIWTIIWSSLRHSHYWSLNPLSELITDFCSLHPCSVERLHTRDTDHAKSTWLLSWGLSQVLVKACLWVLLEVGVKCELFQNKQAEGVALITDCYVMELRSHWGGSEGVTRFASKICNCHLQGIWSDLLKCINFITTNALEVLLPGIWWYKHFIWLLTSGVATVSQIYSGSEPAQRYPCLWSLVAGLPHIWW